MRWSRRLVLSTTCCGGLKRTTSRSSALHGAANHYAAERRSCRQSSGSHRLMIGQAHAPNSGDPPELHHARSRSEAEVRLPVLKQ